MAKGKNANNKKENKKEIAKKCLVCSEPATIICSNCNELNYCSKDHQKEHSNEHKNDCKPYCVQQNKVLGRYLVAARDIKQGEIILKDLPVVVGPPIDSVPLCLNCYKPIHPTRKPFCCPKCDVAPLCSLMCKGTGHTTSECEIFKSNPNLTTTVLMRHCQIITPLRCLLLRNNDPETWKELMKMEAHMEKRRDTPIWRNHKMNIENIIFPYGLLTEDDTKNELVQKICGILDVNTFELRIPGFETSSSMNNALCVRGLYLNAALMSHDCIGNTHLAVDDNFNMIIHASVPIAKGSPICFNYTNALQGTFDRQEHLKEGKYFNCSCKRCSDSTECGTHLSSIICVRCHVGMVTPTKPKENVHTHESIWKCSMKTCNFVCRGSLISSTINCAKNIIEEIDKSDIRSVEFLMRKLLLTFPPEHSLILDLKQSLVGTYSEYIRTEVNPNRKFLNRKLQLCKEILPTLEKVEPGISRLRGITLYEMHIPLVIVGNREYDNGEIFAEELLRKLLEAETILKKAISNLLYEPSASPEGRLASRAMNELKLIRSSITSVERIVENKKSEADKRRKKKK